jgi:hypothetical protein
MRAPSTIKVQAAVYAGGALLCLRHGAAGRRGHSRPQGVRASATDTGVAGDHRADADTGAGLVALAYELLDAHSDTAQLADGLRSDPSWAAHLDYLRALQRTGREMLARTAPDELSSTHSAGGGWLDVR